MSGAVRRIGADTLKLSTASTILAVLKRTPAALNCRRWGALGEDAMSTTTKVKDVLTTGEVAKICNVAPRTVSKWVDSGALHGYRIPGSKDRRIPLNQLIRFMKQHGMPLNR